jgi:TetR/AcrR family hemagglutinin/protease transcriptional regulator
MATSKKKSTGAKPNGHTRAMRLSPDARREQLLVCAIKVFAAHGLVASNHAMVAAAAEVSVPTVFFYFKTREALVEAVLNEVERFYGVSMASAVTPGEPADVTLMNISQTMTRTIDTHPDYCRILMEWSISVRSEIWPRYLRLYRKIIRTVAKVIERGQREGRFRPDLDPNDEAAILHAASSALIQMKETGASQERVDRFQRSMVQSALVQSAMSQSAGSGAAAAPTKRRSVRTAAATR